MSVTGNTVFGEEFLLLVN